MTQELLKAEALELKILNKEIETTRQVLSRLEKLAEEKSAEIIEIRNVVMEEIAVELDTDVENYIKSI